MLRMYLLQCCFGLSDEGCEAAARELIGEAGPELDIQPGFHCDNGKNIRVGRRFTANFNVTILDGAPVTFGDYCMVGPGTLIAYVDTMCGENIGHHLETHEYNPAIDMTKKAREIWDGESPWMDLQTVMAAMKGE